MGAPAAASQADVAAYLRARAAEADGAFAVALPNYARALAADPANPVLALRAYRAAIDAGDLPLITRAGAVLTAADVAPADVALFSLAQAPQRSARDAALARLDQGALAILVPALRGWGAFADGTDPFAPLAAAPKDTLALRFAQENRALLLIAMGRSEEGLAAVRALAGGGRAAAELRLAAAQLLAGQGRAELARAVLVGGDPRVAALRASPQPAQASFAFGVSRLYARVAADLADGESGALTIALLRASLAADPANASARLLLAAQLTRRGLTAPALSELDGIPPGSPFAPLARGARDEALASVGRDADALALARQTAAAPDANAADVRRLGTLLAAAGRPAEAADAFARLLADDPAPDWSDYLQYGGALEQAGHWREGRAALEKAVTLAPDEPLALNYLGYAKVERGEDVRAARALLERAARLRPDDAAIVDSLGWAYYRSGDVARAVPLLERAAAGAPDNATIGEHLGDAYWRVGRRYEARYAWTAARAVAAPAQAARLAARIAIGPAPRP